MTVKFKIYKPASGQFNADSIAFAGMSLVNGDRIDHIVVNGDHILPPPNFSDDVSEILTGFNFLWCSFLLRMGIKKTIVYHVDEKVLARYEVLWQSHHHFISKEGSGYVVVNGKSMPEWIDVNHKRLFYFGVMPKTGNLNADLNLLKSGDYVYENVIYRPKKAA